MRVLKFGGTSVADAEAIERLVAIVRRERASAARPGMLVVVSALSGVTDRLLALAELARRGKSALALESLETLRARHREVTRAVVDGVRVEPVLAGLDEHLDYLGAALKALSVLRELPPRGGACTW